MTASVTPTPCSGDNVTPEHTCRVLLERNQDVVV